jgi:uncharacterized cupin superfamily protein
MSKRIDPKVLQLAVGSGYPAPFHEPCAERTRQRLANAAGLTDFGVNSLHLPPGTWSSQRHWHTEEDEFVFVVEGEVVLVSDSGEEVLGKGDCAGFKAGVRDGHHLQNRSMGDALVLEVGSRKPEDAGEYSDIDMRFALPASIASRAAASQIWLSCARITSPAELRRVRAYPPQSHRLHPSHESRTQCAAHLPWSPSLHP